MSFEEIKSMEIGATEGHHQFRHLARSFTDKFYEYPDVTSNPVKAFFKCLERSLLLPHHDVYFTTGHTLAVLMIVFKKIISRKKFILIVRSNDRFFDFQSFPLYQRILHRWIARHIDGVIAISDIVKNYVERNSDCPIRKVNNFLKDDSYLEVEPDLSSENIVSIGTYYPRKGNDILVALHKKLRQKRNYEGEVFVLGRRDPIPPFIEEYAEDNPTFHLVGYTEPKDYLKRGCFYLQPSRFDAACTSVLEAMAAGLIPLVSENTGNKELVRKIDPSLVLENEPNAFYEKITELMEFDGEEKRKMSEKAKEIASEYTFERVKETFEESFSELVERTQENRR